MGIRQKTLVLKLLENHFREHKLSLSISYQEYLNLLGTSAVHPRSIKKSFKNWKLAMNALSKHYSEPKPEPKPKPKAAPKPAPAKPAPAPKPKAAPKKES